MGTSTWKRSRIHVGTLLVALCAMLVMNACERRQTETKQVKPVRPVQTLVLQQSGISAVRSFPGRVRASQEVDISFEGPGRLLKLPVNKGDTVKKGQLLAQLDQQNFENERDSARARLENAETNFKRAERLVASGAIAQSEYDNRKTLFDLAQAGFNIAQKVLDDTTAKAPFDGVVAKKFVDNFQLVQAKQPILSLQDVSHVEIVANVPEDVIARPRAFEHFKLSASFEAIPGRLFKVTVKEIGKQANRQGQTFPVIMTMPAPEGYRILPGMTATVQAEAPVKAKSGEKAFAIPESALIADKKGQPYVWVVDRKTMTAHKRLVKVGEMSSALVTVLDGLNSGEMIITAGVNHIREDMKVRPLEMRRGGGR